MWTPEAQSVELGLWSFCVGSWNRLPLLARGLLRSNWVRKIIHNLERKSSNSLFHALAQVQSVSKQSAASARSLVVVRSSDRYPGIEILVLSGDDVCGRRSLLSTFPESFDTPTIPISTSFQHSHPSVAHQLETLMVSLPSSIYLPAPSHKISASSPPTNYHIFFITGNPGLIGYYTHFLHTLHSEINARLTLRAHNANVAVYGHSLRGFEVDGNESSSERYQVLGLQEQIDFVQETLKDHIASLSSSPVSLSTSSMDEQKQKHNVILIGHSVGAYILLNLLSSHFSHPSNSLLPNTTVKAGICLFPTVVDIAASPSGRRLGWLAWIPGMPDLAGLVVGILLWIMGLRLFETVVKVLTGMEAGMARVTTGFLKSKHGVVQALYMARDELLTITADKWDSQIWGSAPTAHTPQTSQPAPSKLFFYFGQNDHWVANRTRDDLIALRGWKGPFNKEDHEEESWKPRMEIDAFGVPHGFCLEDEHSRIVALKCREYIESVIMEDLKRGK